jgi:hypothetical protein
MRTFAVVNGRFWTEMSRTGVEIREAGLDVTAVALYLITNPHSNALGLYYLPIAALSHDLRVSHEEALRLLERVCATGFAEFFPEDSLVWVPEQAHYQIGETLKSSDHRRAWAMRELKKYQGTTGYQRFVKRYGESYQLVEKPSPPLRLIAQDQSSGPPAPSGTSRLSEAQRLSQLLDESTDEH